MHELAKASTAGFVILNLLFLPVSVQSASAQVGPAASVTLDECEWCWDEACFEEDQLLISHHWGPGATGVLPFTNPGCVAGWGSTCSTIIPCEGDTFHAVHQRVQDLIATERWGDVAMEVSAHPSSYALIPERRLLVFLAPGCEEAPITALHPVPEHVLEGLGRHTAGVIPVASPVPSVGL
jgi:hypothetical protein